MSPQPESNWTIALISNQPEANELIRYAIHAMFPRIRIIEPKSPHWLVEHFRNEDVTAVVTSYKLYGEIDGISLASQLRARGFSKPVVMISSAEEVASRATREGVDEFLSFDRWTELPFMLARLMTEREAGLTVPARDLPN